MKNDKLSLNIPWEQVKELLKEVDGNLTDEDLEYDPDNEGILLERLAKKMGRNKEHVKGWIESVSANQRPAS